MPYTTLPTAASPRIIWTDEQIGLRNARLFSVYLAALWQDVGTAGLPLCRNAFADEAQEPIIPPHVAHVLICDARQRRWELSLKLARLRSCTRKEAKMKCKPQRKGGGRSELSYALLRSSRPGCAMRIGPALVVKRLQPVRRMLNLTLGRNARG